MKVLCIGNSNIEITCPVDTEVIEEMNLNLVEKYECGGGVSGNIAYLFGKWGVETYIASMLGADDFAQKIKKEYETIGVKTDYIETSYDKGTNQMIVLLNKTNKNKTILNLNNNSLLKKFAFSIEPKLIISDGTDYNASIVAFDKYPNAISFLALNNTNNESLELAKFAKYIVLNKKTAENITNCVIDYENSSTLVNLYNKLKQRYNKSEIIITLGERGCVYSINGQVKIMPPLRVEVVDTNGAGSVFTGAFAYGIGRAFELEKAIAYASIAASLSTTKITSRGSIPSLIDVSNYYDTKFGSENNLSTKNEEFLDNTINMNTASVNNNVDRQNS